MDDNARSFHAEAKASIDSLAARVERAKTIAALELPDEDATKLLLIEVTRLHSEADALKRALVQHGGGLSIRDLAEYAELSTNTVAKWAATD